MFTPTANASGYGFAELRPAQLSGIVGVDTNGDGQYGLTEPGLGGVPILLSGTTFSGATYSRVQTSAASSGVFSFITLPPGVYTLTEQQPAGFGRGSAVSGQFATFPGVVVDANSIGGISSFDWDIETGSSFPTAAAVDITQRVKNALGASFYGASMAPNGNNIGAYLPAAVQLHQAGLLFWFAQQFYDYGNPSYADRSLSIDEK